MTPLTASNLQTGVNTDKGEVNSEIEAQYYQSIPKPQELDEFAVSNEGDNLISPEQENSNIDLFRLEEELGFGLDNPDIFKTL